jgi:hypothetical protein
VTADEQQLRIDVPAANRPPVRGTSSSSCPAKLRRHEAWMVRRRTFDVHRTSTALPVTASVPAGASRAEAPVNQQVEA